MATHGSDWSELPSELLSSIATRLDTRLDVLHFRAVCSSWRKSVPVPPKSPALPVEVHFLVNYPTKPMASFIISQTAVYRIGLPSFHSHSSNKSWFIKLEETKQNNKFRLLNPFSRNPIGNKPASFPKELNHLNFRVMEMTRAFSIRRLGPEGNADLNELNPCIRKIKLASNFDTNAIIMGIKQGELCRMKVAEETQWCLLDSDVQYRDITNFRGKFFTVDLYGVILGIDEKDFTLVEIHSPLEQKVWEAERYFLESSGHLYIVIREFYACHGQVHYDRRIDGFVKERRVEDIHVPVRFRVFKRIPNDYLPNGYDWMEINDLGDRVFFVSTDCSFSFSTRDCEGCRGNCIIYVDEIDKIQRVNNEEGDQDDNDENGLKQLRNGKVGLFNLADRSSGPLAFFPQYLAMFWPPPTWLMWDQCSSSA